MTPWMSVVGANRPGLLGPLEAKVLEALWSRGEPASVRDLQPAFPAIAYTTLMTTLDRLHRKGLLLRTKQGRAFFYQTRQTRQEFDSARVTEALRAAIAQDGATLGPLMSFFVAAVDDHDREALDKLEAVIRARRAELKGGKP